MAYTCQWLNDYPEADFDRCFNECKDKIDAGGTLIYPDNVTTDAQKLVWIKAQIKHLSYADGYKIIGYYDDDLLYAMWFGLKIGTQWTDKFQLFGRNKAGSRSYLYDRDNWAQVINAFIKADGMTTRLASPINRGGADLYGDNIPTLRDDQSLTREASVTDSKNHTYAQILITL